MAWAVTYDGILKKPLHSLYQTPQSTAVLIVFLVLTAPSRACLDVTKSSTFSFNFALGLFFFLNYLFLTGEVPHTRETVVLIVWLHEPACHLRYNVQLLAILTGNVF